mmetsp:Transcript_11936/g.22107  ORF Transcript_11936/g.22107 Transcript_11936/m.22107 type:complete len:322 (+) Transcript_11936:132-1097(+)
MKSLISLAVAFGILGIVFLSPRQKISDHSKFKPANLLNRRAQTISQFSDPKSVNPRDIQDDLNQMDTYNIEFEMCPSNMTHDILMCQKWHNYRFSDALKGHLHERHVQRLRLRYRKEFGSATIVDEYFAQTSSISLRPDVLYEVLKPRLSTTVRHDTAVLHLRLGDTTCLSCWNQIHHIRWVNRLENIYVFPKAYYEHILESLKNIPEVTSVVIVSSTYHAFHGLMKEGEISDAMEGVKQVRDLFSEHGYQVSQRINCGTPDEDFIFMSSHKYYITGGGGYSHLVANMVEQNGGQVFYEPKYICGLANITNDGDCDVGRFM